MFHTLNLFGFYVNIIFVTNIQLLRLYGNGVYKLLYLETREYIGRGSRAMLLLVIPDSFVQI